eukprot:m.195994 g.195994  ORF g.195994 m.195994 type:complete len:110 (+) comp25841_c0_seq4:87-416(+)
MYRRHYMDVEREKVREATQRKRHQRRAKYLRREKELQRQEAEHQGKPLEILTHHKQPVGSHDQSVVNSKAVVCSNDLFVLCCVWGGNLIFGDDYPVDSNLFLSSFLFEH